MAYVTLRQCEEDPNRKDIFGILNDLIQPMNPTLVSHTAASFALSIKEPDEEFFWQLWRDIFDVAQQIPYKNPGQDRLAEFVRELALVPETGARVLGARVWTELPILGAAIREQLNLTVKEDEQVSFHAFVARLLQAGVSPGADTTAIWMLREALEKDTIPAGGVTCAVMSAAMYIEYAGATLVQKMALQPEPQLDEPERRLLKGGPLWKGKSGLTVDRWKFWITRFREQAEHVINADASYLAIHAARLIEVWTLARLSTH